jgi:hypothetical protein
MKNMRKILLSAAFAGLLGLIGSLSAAADEPTVLRVLLVQTADVPGYVHEVESLRALLKKANVADNIRVWQATYAGPDTGAIVVSIEYPNFAALAKANDALRTNPELAAQMAKINKIRKVLSDSLYNSVSH